MGSRSPQLESLCLNSKIPAAIHAKYQNIQDARHWRNPRITIRADGVEVASGAIRGGRRVVLVEELRGLLVRLPIKAWPYGRVILATDIGLRQADGRDDNSIRPNHDAVEKILKALDIEADWWPSA
jgi:hypothetical protein